MKNEIIWHFDQPKRELIISDDKIYHNSVLGWHRIYGFPLWPQTDEEDKFISEFRVEGVDFE